MNAEVSSILRNVESHPPPAPVAPVAPAESRVRVLQFGPGLGVRGGVSSVEQLICDYLPPYASIRHVPTMEEGTAWTRVSTFARAIGVLRRALVSTEPTIFHVHFASRGSTLRKMILASMVAHAGRPLVLHAHGGGFDRFHARLPPAVRVRLNSCLQRASVFIALSQRWRDFYIDTCELSPAQVTVLPNPVRWNPDVPNRAAHTRVQFLALGRISPGKGSFDLIRAFGALPPGLRARSRLVLAGDGDVEGARRAAAPLGNAVQVRDWVGAAERDRLLAESDVFVLPSHAEGLPMSLLEAMSSGLPSIVTPVGGIPDVFTHEVEGLFVAPGRVDELAAAMTRLLNADGERTAAGRRAHARARALDVHVYARRLGEIYQRIAPIADCRGLA
jgi:glycosyltransferase involved in cell wall biosynthesis